MSGTAIQKTEPAMAVQIRRGDERLAVTTDNAKQLMVKPIRILPADLRPTMFKFWLFWKVLPNMESPISFCTAFAQWIDNKGLRHDDAIEVMEATTEPSKVANIQFSSQLMALVGQAVAEKLKRRAEESAEQERRRRKAEEDSKPRATPEELEQWRKFRSEVFSTGVRDANGS